MRNLKRALSLGLTAAMISGLMVMGSSAVSYPDSDQIQNQTAVEILGEIGVMVGDDNGNFNPTQDVTRAEMAVIITRILYGNDLNVDQFKGMNLFTDVPAWAEGFVNLCASLDIVAGVGDGKFAPNETVTAAQAALMLSRALGYFQNNAEFGNDWALAAIRRATSAGIIGDDMVLAANEGLSRDNVAQMTFNTLTKAVPVQYNELLNVYYNENQGITYALTFNYLQTLGYTNFDLVYDNGDTTIYGRPATTWGIGSYRTTTSDKDSGSRYDEALDANGGLISSNVQILSRDEIITIPNEATYTYTDGTAEEDIYDDLGDARCNDQRGQKAEDEYDWTVYVNGEEVAADDVVIPARNEGDDYAYTGEGVQTEIYVDDGDKTVTVVEINYYLAQVSSVNETEGTVSIRTISDLKADKAELDDRTFATTEFAKGDYVVFTIDQNADDDFYICEMTAPETVDGTVTRVNKDNTSDNSYLFLDRENRYYYSDHMAYDLNDETVVQHPSLEEDYTLFLDPNGYVLAYSGDTTKSFLYVQDSDEELSDWEARVVLADGTDDVVMVDDDLDNADDSAFYQTGDDEDIDWIDEDRFNAYKAEFGTWPDRDELASYSETRTKISDIDYQIWEYETNADGDLYTLTGRDTRYMSGVEINNGEAYIDFGANRRDVLIDNSTIFVDVDGNVAYTGYDAVPDVSNADIAYVLADDNDRDVAEIVYIINGDFYDADAIFFVLTSEKRDTEKYDGDYYFEFEDMYVDGYDRDGLYVSYDALKGLLPSLDEDDGDADRSNAVDQEIEDNMEGKVFKVLKSEDGTYITQIALVDDWDPAATATSSALDVMEDYRTDVENPNWNLSKYKTNSDTTYVLVEEIYEYDRNDDPIALEKYDVSEGGYSDIIEHRDWDDKDNDGYITTVQVLKAEDGTANLVYIYKYNPAYGWREVTVNLDGVEIDRQNIRWWDEVMTLNQDAVDAMDAVYTGEAFIVTASDESGDAVDAKIYGYEALWVPEGNEDVVINIATPNHDILTKGKLTLNTEWAYYDPYDADATNIWLGESNRIYYSFTIDGLSALENPTVTWTETIEADGNIPTIVNQNKTGYTIEGNVVYAMTEPNPDFNANSVVTIKVSDLVVTPEEQAADLPELSVIGDNVKVYVENALATPTNDTPAGMVYEIKDGSNVVVSGLSVNAGEKYILSDKETVATVNDRGQLVFEMPKADIDLSDMVRGYTIVDLGEGITLNDGDVKEGDVVATGTDLTVTSTTGNYMVKTSAQKGYIDTTATAVAADNTIEVTGDLRIYAAVGITNQNATNIAITVPKTDGTTEELGANTYIAVGTEITLNTTAGTNANWGIVNTSGGALYSEDLDGKNFTIKGTADVSFNTGYLVTLGAGVTIGEYTEEDTVIALCAPTGTQFEDYGFETSATNIIAEPANNVPYSTSAIADTESDIASLAGKTLVAATLVSVTADDTVGYRVESIDSEGVKGNTSYYFVPNTIVYVTVDTGAAQVAGADVTEVTTSGKLAVFTVNYETVTVTAK